MHTRLIHVPQRSFSVNFINRNKNYLHEDMCLAVERLEKIVLEKP